MKRHLLNLLTALSLLLCVAVVALWVRSHGYADRLRYARGRFDARVESESGVLLVRWTTAWPGVSLSPAMSSKPAARHGDAPWVESSRSRSERWDFDTGPGGFGYGTVQSPRVPYVGEAFCRWRAASVPYWAVLATSAVMPCLWITGRTRRRYRRLQSLCPSCGYDLRATPDRCPECGGVDGA